MRTNVRDGVRGARSLARHRESFTRRLLAWYERSARDLPWRRTRDPYRVLVSEVMLQQTQVSRVSEFYPRFLERFPDLHALARAKPRAVREAWDGLGYYARASNLHALARVVSRDFGGRVPESPQALVKLPGVGPYTAGAVASFAYEKPVPAVDTNVARVIRRVFFGMRDGACEMRDAGCGMRGAQLDHASRIPHPASRKMSHPASREVWRIAAALVPRNGKKAWKFNQAMMELGALVCVAKKPKCPECPVRTDCKLGRRSVGR